jgi:hypothetical protein
MRLFIGENEAKIRELADYLLDCSEVRSDVWISCAGFPAGVRAARAPPPCRRTKRRAYRAPPGRGHSRP